MLIPENQKSQNRAQLQACDVLELKVNGLVLINFTTKE